MRLLDIFQQFSFSTQLSVINIELPESMIGQINTLLE